jgi:hypothetical protein
MSNPQLNNNAHKLIFQIRVQPQPTPIIQKQFPTYMSNRQPNTHMHNMNFNIHFEFQAQSSPTQNNSQIKSTQASPNIQKMSSEMNVDSLARTHHTLMLFKIHIQSFSEFAKSSSVNFCGASNWELEKGQTSKTF